MKPMLSDDSLRNAVLKELEDDPDLVATHVSVTSIDGAITLRGHVMSYHERHAAVRAAERVAAVRAVADELEVREPSLHARSDDEIAEEVAHARARVANSPDSVRVQVREGSVILYGQVESAEHREAIENAARHLPGVVAVENLIEIETPPDATAAEVQRRVQSTGTGEIGVTVQDGVVRLDGHAPSLSALEEAVAAARAVPGVTAVESAIVVSA
jgi:osmotically-inducible protein OsmY